MIVIGFDLRSHMRFSKLFTIATLSATLGACALKIKPPEYEHSSSLALNIARAANIGPSILRDVQVSVWNSGTESQRIANESPPIPDPNRTKSSLFGTAVGIGLGLAFPLPGMSGVASAGFNTGMNIALGANSGNDQIRHPGLPHVLIWVHDTNNTPENLANVALRKALLAASKLSDSEIELRDEIFEYHHSKSPGLVFVKRGCSGGLADGVFRYDRNCSGEARIYLRLPVPESEPPPEFVSGKQPVYGPIEPELMLSGITAPSDPDWYIRFSAALPQGYYVYLPEYKGNPVILDRGNILKFTN